MANQWGGVSAISEGVPLSDDAATRGSVEGKIPLIGVEGSRQGQIKGKNPFD
ncbi:hypothetical protein D3C75_512010 [compost metagenome]